MVCFLPTNIYAHMQVNTRNFGIHEKQHFTDLHAGFDVQKELANSEKHKKG